MRTSRLNVAIGFLAIAPLMSALAACDEAQESTPITDVSPMGEPAVVAGTVGVMAAPAQHLRLKRHLDLAINCRASPWVP